MERPRASALPLLLFLVAAALASETFAPAELESDLLEAVFRQQVAEMRGEARVLCLAIDSGSAPQSVTREFLARFRFQDGLRRAAECEVGRDRAYERSTRAPAVVVTAGPIEWVAEDEAWVTVEQVWSASRSTRRPYRVVRQKSRWMSLGPILRGPL